MQTNLNIPPANRTAASHTDVSAMARSPDAQAEHFLRRCTGVLLWRHRTTTAELPFT
ncbi:MAG: hypothetical protein LJE57_09305 [Gallionella sp.]|nr:hypothetical protein [Gallionella sp.]